MQLRQDSHPYLGWHGVACLICEVDLGEVRSRGDDGGDCPGQGMVDHGKMPPGSGPAHRQEVLLLPPDTPYIWMPLGTRETEAGEPGPADPR